MRWRFLFFFYMKHLGRSKLYLGASVLLLLLLISRLILYFSSPHDMEEYGQLPGEVAMIVQMVSILYIVFFYRTHAQELIYNVQSFFSDGYKIMWEKISSMFLSHLLYQGIITVVVYGIFTGVYLGVNIEPSSFYLSLFRFLTVYLFAPLTFCMLYGVIVAMLCKGRKISFFVILLIWIWTGSMKTELFPKYFSNVQAHDFQSLFYIGMNTVQHVYLSYTGFDVHWGNELKIATWFLVMTGAMFILTFRWGPRVRERNSIIKVLIIIIILSVISSLGVVEVSTKAFNRGDYNAETETYKNMNKVKTDIRYEINSYSILLKDKKATVEIAFNHVNTLKPTFQLYYAYPIKWIKADNQLVKFKRSGDIVEVSLPTKPSSLTFHYEIVDTNFVPYTNNRTVLLADKAWYPKKRTLHMYEFNEDGGWLEINEQFLPNESYHFSVYVKDKLLFINLPGKDGVYKGETQAVSLIKGQGNHLIYGNYHVIYPADWPNMRKRVSTVLSLLEKTLDEIQQIAPTTVPSLPKSIVFSNYGLSSLITKDHLVYNTGYGDAVDAYDTTKDFQEKMLQLVVQRKGPSQLHKEWINMTSKLIRKQNNWHIDYNGRSSESFFLDPEEQQSIELLYRYFNQLDLAGQMDFLKEWYERMDETWNWSEVLGLIKERVR